MKPSETLQAALDKLQDGKAWVQGYAAINNVGKVTDSKCSDAVKWCMDGVLSSLTPTCAEWGEAADYIYQFTPDGCGMVRFNDESDRTWPEVKEVFIKAIAAAKADEANSTEGNQ